MCAVQDFIRIIIWPLFLKVYNPPMTSLVYACIVVTWKLLVVQLFSCCSNGTFWMVSISLIWFLVVDSNCLSVTSWLSHLLCVIIICVFWLLYHFHGLISIVICNQQQDLPQTWYVVLSTWLPEFVDCITFCYLLPLFSLFLSTHLVSFSPLMGVEKRLG